MIRRTYFRKFRPAQISLLSEDDQLVAKTLAAKNGLNVRELGKVLSLTIPEIHKKVGDLHEVLIKISSGNPSVEVNHFKVKDLLKTTSLSEQSRDLLEKAIWVGSRSDLRVIKEEFKTKGDKEGSVRLFHRSDSFSLFSSVMSDFLTVIAELKPIDLLELQRVVRVRESSGYTSTFILTKTQRETLEQTLQKPDPLKSSLGKNSDHNQRHPSTYKKNERALIESADPLVDVPHKGSEVRLIKGPLAGMVGTVVKAFPLYNEVVVSVKTRTRAVETLEKLENLSRFKSE